MPRRSSSGRSGRPAARRSPPLEPVRHAPPAPVQKSSSSSGGFLGTIAEGMAFGTGTAIAHRAVNAVMGPRTIQHEGVVSATPAPVPAATGMGGSAGCDVHSKAFQDCLNSYGSDISKCQFYMDMLSECRKNSGSMITN